MLLTGRGRPRRPAADRRPEGEARRSRRAAFRSWRRTRPFWAGLLLILAGAEMVAIPLSPLQVLVSLGLGGLAAIGIGLALVVAGLFLWFAPRSRAYVSIHALLLSVVSFAATNLGGFLLGMTLGIVGSAMGFGWTPAAPAAPGPGGAPAGDPRRPAAAPAGDRTPDAAGAGGRGPWRRPGRGRGKRAAPAETGPDTGDRPGRAPAAPGAAGPPGRDRAPAPRTAGPSPPPRAPGGRATRTLAALLPLVLLTAFGPPAAGAGPAGERRTGPPEPARAGTLVAATPASITARRFTPHGFLVAGVTELPTADGPLKVMVLKMRAASLTDYRMTARGETPAYGLSADSLELTGHVTLYLSRFSGCVEGLICLTFTPDRLPVPPLVPPFVFITRVEGEQAFVTADSITTTGLDLP
ncbi:DUF6114 domain-containing protein [Streptomyces sp. NPDC018031]|uniref:DUF6114 domain-containing protein n=1 Tax=Streptomyces sp. NPDC018031 TaxID=3365033 RepID=UPI0037ACE8F6